MPSPLHRSKSQSLQFPHHTCYLILVFMNTSRPPFPPLLKNRQSKLIPQPSQPGEGARNRDTIINISLSNPYPKTCLNQNWIQPVTGILVHGIVCCNIVTAGIESLERNMQRTLDADLIEEMADAKHILTNDIISHKWSLSSMWKSHKFSPFSNFHFLIQTLSVDVKHAGISSIEFLISNFPHSLTGITPISKYASTLNIIILCISIITVIIKILVLIDAHIQVITRFIALSGISAGAVDHDTLEVDSHFSVGELVSFEDLVGQVGDVDACIAFTSQVELIFFQVREFVEECQQSFVVIKRNCSVVVLEGT